ncbi:MAG TPA: hypothetical protein DEA52_06025 [Clostridiaceae bacterium]|nr:hypothetical protein [Clostridiaceae bacterium]
MDIFYKNSMCTHSRVCLRGNPQVFNVKRKPWILEKEEPSLKKVLKTLDACPTKALRYIIHEKEEPTWNLSKEKIVSFFSPKKGSKQEKLFMRYLKIASSSSSIPIPMMASRVKE